LQVGKLKIYFQSGRILKQDILSFLLIFYIAFD
jgi:hypothetical protein